jgi:hypothetical protein
MLFYLYLTYYFKENKYITYVISVIDTHDLILKRPRDIVVNVYNMPSNNTAGVL